MEDEKKIQIQKCKDFINKKVFDKIKQAVISEFQDIYLENFVDIGKQKYGYLGEQFINDYDKKFFESKLILTSLGYSEFEKNKRFKDTCLQKVTDALKKLGKKDEYSCSFGKSDITKNTLFVYTEILNKKG